MSELKEVLKEEGLVLGRDRTLKKMRIGDIKNVFISSNCPKKTEETIRYYAKITKAKVTKLKIDNKELGIKCKKPFSVCVFGY